MMNPQSDKLSDKPYDPNPLDPAEYSLTLRATADAMIDIICNPQSFAERMHDLYGGGCPKVIIDRCLVDLRDRGQTTIYVGTLKQCVAFTGSFAEMGFKAQYDEIKL